MKLLKIMKNEKGQLLPMVAIILGLFALGFTALVVDTGILFMDRKAMITSADAAALAGAEVLRQSEGLDVEGAKKTAEEYAIANGGTPIKVEISENKKEVEVIVNKNQPLFFARFLGDDNSDVKATAIAEWRYVSKTSAKPFFVFDSSYEIDKEIVLHQNIYLVGEIESDDDIEDIDLMKTNSFGFIRVNDNNSMNDIKEALKGNIIIDPYTIGDVLGAVPGTRESVHEAALLLVGKTIVIPIIDRAEFDKIEVNTKKNASKWVLPVKFFAYLEITEVVNDNPVEINGKFTSETIELINEEGIETSPNPGKDPPAMYIKLIK